MGDVIQFKQPKLAEKHKHKILCQRGFHKWKLHDKHRFDVKQGRLVTVYRCQRCGAMKNEAR